MNFYEVRAKAKRYCASHEILNLMCTTKKKAIEIGEEWAKEYPCVWIIRCHDCDGVIIHKPCADMITIRDEFGY